MESVCVLRLTNRIALLNEEHLINVTVKFSLALCQNVELAFFKEACISMGCQKMFIYRGIFMFDQQHVDVHNQAIYPTWFFRRQIMLSVIRSGLVISQVDRVIAILLIALAPALERCSCPEKTDEKHKIYSIVFIVWDESFNMSSTTTSEQQTEVNLQHIKTFL